MIYCFKRNVNFHLAAGEGTPADGAVSSEVSGDCRRKGAGAVQTIWTHLLRPSASSLGCVLLALRLLGV